MKRIDEKLPLDMSVLDDTIESGLCRGDIIQVSRLLRDLRGPS